MTAIVCWWIIPRPDFSSFRSSAVLSLRPSESFPLIRTMWFRATTCSLCLVDESNHCCIYGLNVCSALLTAAGASCSHKIFCWTNSLSSKTECSAALMLIFNRDALPFLSFLSLNCLFFLFHGCIKNGINKNKTTSIIFRAFSWALEFPVQRGWMGALVNKKQFENQVSILGILW